MIYIREFFILFSQFSYKSETMSILKVKESCEVQDCPHLPHPLVHVPQHSPRRRAQRGLGAASPEQRRVSGISCERAHRERDSQLPGECAENRRLTSGSALPHLHQGLREEATTAPQLSTHPAPCGPLAHLPDHVTRRQVQLVLLLRTISGQDQHLCGRRMARAHGSEEPSRG